MIPIERSSGISEQLAADLARELHGRTTLQDVVRWAFALSPPRDVSQVVVQDEYTHDVVIPWRDVFLVFDTT